ncbi:unnamed protein product, partial [Heterotrigona itama]
MPKPEPPVPATFVIVTVPAAFQKNDPSLGTMRLPQPAAETPRKPEACSGGQSQNDERKPPAQLWTLERRNVIATQL